MPPAKFSGTFLYLITCLELAVHFPPLGRTRSGQASRAIQTKHYFGGWQPQAGFCSAGPIIGSVPASILPPLWLPHPPASVYCVLSDAVDLGWLTVVDIIYMSHGRCQADIASKSHVPSPQLAQEEEAVEGRCPEVSLLERAVETPSLLTLAFEFLELAFETVFTKWHPFSPPSICQYLCYSSWAACAM